MLERLSQKEIEVQYPWSRYKCNSCGATVTAYYTLSYLTKGLWVNCPKCGIHARPYVGGLHLYHRPSKDFIKRNTLPEEDIGILSITKGDKLV